MFTCDSEACYVVSALLDVQRKNVCKDKSVDLTS